MAKKATEETTFALLKGAALTKEIDAIGKSATQMLARIHHAAASACAEALELRNCNAINRLDKACEHVGGRALRRWLAKHGPVTWDSEAKKFVLSNDKCEELDEEFDSSEEYGEELATGASPTEEAKPNDSNPFQKFDTNALLANIKRKYEALTDEQKADPRNNFANIDKILELYGKTPALPKKKKKATADGEVPFDGAELVAAQA